MATRSAKESLGAAEATMGTSKPAGGLLLDIIALSKPRVSIMVLVATLVGYLMASRGHTDWIHLGGVLLATLMVDWGIMAVNQYMERDTDRLMERTKNRPLPSGRMQPGKVLALAVLACAVGIVLLAVWANLLTAVVGLLVVVTYLACYTPLKRHSGLNTLVGAIPGALPPVLGWAAAQGSIGRGALAIFLILFIWQPPHFLSIAYLYRKEYARAGLFMLPAIDPSGRILSRQLIVYSATLIPISMYPSMIGLTGSFYFFGALGLSMVFFLSALAMALRTGEYTARILLKVSVTYLPILFVLMIYDAMGHTAH
jgi:protoheme IX farnesyltransferase